MMTLGADLAPKSRRRPRGPPRGVQVRGIGGDVPEGRKAEPALVVDHDVQAQDRVGLRVQHCPQQSSASDDRAV